MVFVEAQVQGPINVATVGKDDETLTNLGTDREIVELTYGKEFNITYQDQSTIFLCEVKKQSSKVLLRNGLSNDDGESLLT